MASSKPEGPQPRSNFSKFYAVALGRTPGIYTSWDDAREQVDRFSGAKYKAFSTIQEAEKFVDAGRAPGAGSATQVPGPVSGLIIGVRERPYNPVAFSDFTLAKRTDDPAQDSGPTPVKQFQNPQGPGREAIFQIWTGPGNGGKSRLPASQQHLALDPSNLTPFKPTKKSGGKYYAVAVGKTPGIYRTWEEAKVQIQGFPKAVYKGFYSLEEAQAYLTPPIDTGVERKDRLVIYIDGSFRNGKAGAGVWFPEEKKGLSREVPATFGRPTNNSGEVYAAYVALLAVPDRKVPLLIHPDSMYVINTVNGKWGVNENVELFKLLLEEVQGRDIVWEHVYGHTGVEGNEQADYYAGLSTQ